MNLSTPSFEFCQALPKMNSSSPSLEFCRVLPKIELHAHLNGSLSPATMKELMQLHRARWPEEKMPEDSDTLIKSGEKGTFDDPFRMFGIIQGITDNPEAVSLATRATVSEFASDGVRYLELRSTPRQVVGRMTREEYCRAILDELASLPPEGITVKLILAIDRRRLEDMEDTVNLFQRLSPSYPGLLVGLDLSGDARVGDLVPLLPRLSQLRHEGIQLAVHLAEVPNPVEVAALLKFKPDRIGHGTCIHPNLGGSPDLWNILQETRTPVEVCLTSNLTCNSVPSAKEHQAGLYKDSGLPIILCTDDKGVFSCSLSGEYHLAASTFSWDKKELFSLSRSAISHTFATSDEKKKLLNQWDSWSEANYDEFD